ncbi:MAG: tRNA (adenosine(37)-N6)-dimethylallyltransferase MiaA [Treponema sp.]|nr:tRNA (adenosine(37)-N6)-dimethylallyltransferase MiaA [Treponema sp.]
MNRIPVIVIFAPTASGKTALTLDLFSEEGSFLFLKGKAEVISADSMAIYKYMDIGTAKPDPAFCKKIPHHLVDFLDPKESFSAADFVNMADKACEEIFSRGKIPCIVGGTGFYIRSFLLGLPDTPESDEKLRASLKERISVEGKEKLYEELKKLDPESAAKIHVNDEYRICRALEVYYSSGKKRSSFSQSPELRNKYRFSTIILNPPRDVLYSRIEQRVEKMFEAGLPEEISRLKEMGYTQESAGIRAIGYKEFFLYDNPEKIKERIIHNTKIYAKKQITFMRNIPGAMEIPYTASAEDIEKVKSALTLLT